MRLRGLLSGIAIALGLSAPAIGADITPRSVVKAVPYVAPFSWTGLLVGGEIGWGTDDLSAALNAGRLSGTASSTTGSFVAGGVVDLLYELPGTPLVIGNELSVDRVFATASASSQPSWLGKAELVLGFAPAPYWLVYASGGFAYQALDGSLSISNGVINIDPKGDGWTIGAGVDYAIAGTPLVLGFKYNHVDITGPTLNIQNAAFLSTGSQFDQFMARALLKF